MLKKGQVPPTTTFFKRVILLKGKKWIKYCRHTPINPNACYPVYLTKNNKQKKQKLKRNNMKKDKSKL